LYRNFLFSSGEAALHKIAERFYNLNEFLSFSEDRRRTVCEQAQDRLALPPATIEKDFWVCWTLKKLFDLPEWGSHLTFKGGTLLSKGWALPALPSALAL